MGLGYVRRLTRTVHPREKKLLAGAKKVLDNRAGILYNKDRSEEERKTLGPTADLPIFKAKKFFQKSEKNRQKGVAIRAGL